MLRGTTNWTLWKQWSPSAWRSWRSHSGTGGQATYTTMAIGCIDIKSNNHRTHWRSHPSRSRAPQILQLPVSESDGWKSHTCFRLGSTLAPSHRGIELDQWISSWSNQRWWPAITPYLSTSATHWGVVSYRAMDVPEKTFVISSVFEIIQSSVGRWSMVYIQRGKWNLRN